MKKLIDRLALFEPCKRTVLPEYGGCVGECALKSFMAALKSSVAKLKSFIENLPEFFFALVAVTCGCAGDVYEIYGYNTLIESAVIFRLTVFIDVRS